MTPEELARTREREIEAREQPEHTVHVCVGTGCEALGSPAIAKNLEAELKAAGKDKTVKVKCVGCPGLCAWPATRATCSANERRSGWRGTVPGSAW